MKDTIEVEQKFKVESHDPYLAKLPSATIPVAFGVPTLEVDIYYQHPAKNLQETDEVIRIRNWREIIYKGPKLSDEAKVRHEYTWKMNNPELLLETLGFKKLIEVSKRRITGNWSDSTDGNVFFVTMTLDTLKDLGNFIEIEIVTDKNNMKAAIKRLEGIAKELGLENQELKGYAQLILEKSCQMQNNYQN